LNAVQGSFYRVSLEGCVPFENKAARNSMFSTLSQPFFTKPLLSANTHAPTHSVKLPTFKNIVFMTDARG
jgi:hypothetical protein